MRLVETALFIELDEQSNKIRKFLLTISATALFYSLTDSTITEFAPLGINLKDITKTQIGLYFSAFITYQLVNYYWHAFDSIQEWRIRLTGASDPVNEHKYVIDNFTDHPKIQRNSSLIHWWSEQIENLLKLESKSRMILKNIENENVSAPLSSQIDELNKLIKLASIDRIEASLNKLENWYQFMKSSQNIRFFLFNLLVPFAISVTAMVRLLL